VGSRVVTLHCPDLVYVPFVVIYPFMSGAPRSSDPDHDLVMRARNGDTRAFDELIIKYGDRLHGLVYHMTFHQEDTNDLLQEIFTAAYQSLSGFKGGSSFYTWIYQIAVNRTLNFLKKRKRRTGVSLEGMEGLLDDASLVDTTNEANPERQARLRELQARLDVALQGLSERHRMVVNLYDIQGLSHGEIARILKISEGTIRSRLHYAHLKLQSALQESWAERC
jgi:RNA polymerase sigma factor (sigma-70 family)